MKNPVIADIIFGIIQGDFLFITSIAAAAGGSRRRLPKAGVERSSCVGIAYTISVKLSN